MQIEDIISPTYSVSSQVLKLNSSAAASESSAGQLSKPIVYFQQFNPHNHNLFSKQTFPKKQLTIQIDQFDHAQSTGDSTNIVKQHENYMDNKNKHLQHEYIENSHRNRTDITRKSLQSAKLKKQSQVQDNNMTLLMKQNQQLKALLKKKDEIIEMHIIRNEQLSLKLSEREQQERENKFYDDKLRQKQSKYRQLQKVNEKIVVMNKTLQKQLRENEKKIMQLQKQLQKNVCKDQSDNIAKIKQNSIKLKQSSLKMLNPMINNKENTLSNTIKSLQKKKITSTSNQVKKSSRIVSSTINMAKKFQIKNI